MSIKSIYATNILVKQLDISDEDLTTVENFLKAEYMSFMTSDEKDQKEYPNGNEGLVKLQEYLKDCPEFNIVYKQVEQAFLELAYSNIETHKETNTEKAVLEFIIESTKINWMKTGGRLGIHTHYGDDAYAVFYFEDVPEREGGSLILHDPRWSRNYMFGGAELVRIQPRRGQLVIAPSYIWHEVELYTGQEDRFAFVFNGTVQNVYDYVRVRKTPHTY